MRAFILRWVKLQAHLSVRKALAQRRQIKRQKAFALNLIINQEDALPGSPQFDRRWLDKLPSWRQTGEDQPRCYSYALDQGAVGYSAPSHFGARLNKTEVTQESWTPEALTEGLRRDGIKPYSSDAPLSNHSWIISGFVSRNGEDFHFKRLDANGVVSDKPSLGAVRSLTVPSESPLRITQQLTEYRNPHTRTLYFSGIVRRE